MGRRALLLAALFLLPMVLVPSAQACVGGVGVPCGRIYPIIMIKVDGDATMWNLTAGTPVEVKATVTYSFDMVNEGYTAAAPNEPIEIRFEYPRKPDWAGIKVTPEVIPVDVNNPTSIEPDPSQPTQPQGRFSYSAPITITLTLAGKPVLRDGYDFAKLLVFAKSSESGLYQSGYGIKELRVIPEGAVHEADVAGLRDVFQATPLPPIALQGAETSFAGTTVMLTPPASPKFWEPSEFAVSVSPAPAGRMLFAVHDESGELLASSPLLDAASGAASLNVTLVTPGQHTATLTLLPSAGTLTPPLTFALPFDVAPSSAEGFLYPKTYVVQTTEAVPAPLGNRLDPLAQFERDIPFFVFDTAQSVSATLTLLTDLPVDLGRAAANLQFSIHDPDGNMLQAGSVDPTKPTWSLRVGSVPGEGWYVVRIKGVGAPAASRYDVRIEANYAAAHQARNRADGIPDLTGGLLTRTGANLTLPADGLALWAPRDLTPVREPLAAMSYTVTVYDANGTLTYASGARTGASTFSAPAPGTYRAYVLAEPVRGAVPFSPIVRAFTFEVGRGNTTVTSTFDIDDGFEAPVSATPTLLGYHAVHVLAGASAPTFTGGELVDAEGGAVTGDAPGVYYLSVAAPGMPPSGSVATATLQQKYANAVTLAGPDVTGDGGRPLPVPGLAIALTLIGALAVGLALARR